MKNTTTKDYNEVEEGLLLLTFNNSFIEEIKIEKNAIKPFFLIIYFVDEKNNKIFLNKWLSQKKGSKPH